MGPISASLSASGAAKSGGGSNQFGNVQQGDNSTSSGFGKNLPLVIIAFVGLAIIGGLVWLVSRDK